MNREKIHNVHFLGVKIDNATYDDALETIRKTVSSNSKGYVCVTDVGNVIKASRDRKLADAINASLLSVADGMPLAWFARLAGAREIERIAGMDLMVRLFADQNGYRHFLLGDTEERIARVMKKSRELNPDMQIHGYSPPFKTFDNADNRMMIERLNRENPDIIWVSFGGGKQETWMHDTIADLDHGIMIGIGAGFKWFLGDLRTPPAIIQKMGLQWTFRQTQNLLENPGNAKRVARILLQKLIFCFHFPGELFRARRRHETSRKTQ